ncbi:MAG: Holliday junction branch migration protein RuvA, partial [Chloroflexi bacterium]|nr:Holliday junction branch migration protein RuvA [Chloroflexota bacterium]
GLGRDVRLHTYLHVRDNELALYGFASEDELDLFELLLGVNGVGPRTALSALSALRPEDLRRAVVQGDGELLRHIPGIGRKTAERIILDLKDKLGMEGGPARGAPSVLDAEVVAALTTLGYSLAEAREAVGSLPAGELSLEEKVMLALRYLGKE